VTVRRQIIAPVILPLLVAGLLGQVIVNLLRVTMTYEVLGQGFGAGVVGLMSAMFSLLPVFLTVQIGRFNDRGKAPLATVLGASSVLCGAVLLWVMPPSLTLLLAVTAAMGVWQR
jgi:hypothetical protein